MKSFFLIAALAAMFVAPAANAGLYIQENLSPAFDSETVGTTNPTTAKNSEGTMGFDSRTTLGWSFFGKLLVGGSLNYGSKTTTLDADATYGGHEYKSTKMEYGPTVGFLFQGLHANFTYLLGNNWKFDRKTTNAGGAVATDETFNYKTSQGMQLDVGYAFHVAPKFKIGPSIVWKKVNYKEQEYTDNKAGTAAVTTTLDNNQVESDTTVMLTAVFDF